MDKPKFYSTWFYVPTETSTEHYRGWFGGIKEKTQIDIRNPDMQSYADRLTEAYTELDQHGYDVVNVVPMNMGTNMQNNKKNGEYVGDTGFSITRGAVVVGKLRTKE